MLHHTNENYLNPYDYNNPYQPGQGLPHYDEKKMMDITCLQRFSGVYCNNLPIGSCSQIQLPNRLHCSYHSCHAILTDGTPCPNPSANGSSYCATGYHEENGRYPILHSPRSSFSPCSSDDHSSSTMTDSYETVWSQHGTHSGSQYGGSNDGHDGHSAHREHYAESHQSGSQHHDAYVTETQHSQAQHPQNQSHGAQLIPRSGIQWNSHYSHSQPASQYYYPSHQNTTEYATYGTTQGTESEWGTIEKRSFP